MSNINSGIPLHFPKVLVRPSGGEQKMRCGRCHHYEFGVYVQPTGDVANVAALICTHCLKVFKIVGGTVQEKGTSNIVTTPEQQKEQAAS